MVHKTCGLLTTTTLFTFLISATLYSTGWFSNGSAGDRRRISNTAVEVNFIQNFISMRQNETAGKRTTTYRSRKIKHHVPKYMLELYEESILVTANRMAKNRPDVVKSVIPINAESISGAYFRLQTTEVERGHVLIFNIPISNGEEIFASAELRILTIVQHHPNTILGAERIFHISFYDGLAHQIIQLEKRHIYHTNNTWISFNVTSAVRRVLTQHSNMLKLIVMIHAINPEVLDNKATLALSLLPNSGTADLEHDYPFLLLSYSIPSSPSNLAAAKPPIRIRKKRSVDLLEDYEEETNQVWTDETGPLSRVAKRKRRLKNTCKKKPLYVDFADINYDSWIVQPTGYEAYQCMGKCFYPVADHLSPTKHAVIQALMHSMAPQSTPRSCCVPTRLGSISILYVDSKGVLTYRYGYEDMVVTECGCR